MQTMHVIRIAAAALAVIGLVHGAGASETDGLRIVETQVQMPMGDIDMNNPKNAEPALKRIQHAARQACGGMAERDPFYRTNPDFVDRQFRKCVRQAVRSTVARMGQPALQQAFLDAYGERTIRRDTVATRGTP